MTSLLKERNPMGKLIRPRRKSSKSDYKVGYRNPPRETQFRPGQSGNPKGRPKGAKEAEMKAAAADIPTNYAIDLAISELLRSDPNVRKLLDRWFALAREREDLRRALRIVEHAALIAGQPPPFGNWNVTEFNFRGQTFELPGIWQAALAELQNDADAPLPT